MRRDVYVVGMQAVSGDVIVGQLFFDRFEAEQEVRRLEKEEEYTTVWFDIRQIEDK